MIRQKQRDELHKYLLAPERTERNMLKLCEEMAELQEVILKWVNKTPENRPPLSKLIEEGGDVLFRLEILAYAFDIEYDINTRKDEKEEQVYNWYLAKQLKGQETQ